MKKVSIILFFLLLPSLVYSQNNLVKSKLLKSSEVDSIFTDKLVKDLEIDFSIYRVYQYEDKSGEYFIVMTENEVECSRNEECFDSIKAYCFSHLDGRFSLKWKMKDFILNDKNEGSDEYSIWFWTNYFELKDYEEDGLIDPILVYGTVGLNGTSDGRMKILVWGSMRMTITTRGRTSLHGMIQIACVCENDVWNGANDLQE